MSGIHEGHGADDRRAEIRGLNTVSRIAKARHQLHEHSRNFLRIVSALSRNVGKAVSRQRWDDEVECVLGTAAVGRWIGQRLDHLVKLHERAGPAVDDDQRQGVWPLSAPMNEMDVEAVDLRLELLEPVEPTFLRTPIERVPPIGDEVFQIGEIGSVIPASAFDFIGEACASEARFRSARRRPAPES